MIRRRAPRTYERHALVLVPDLAELCRWVDRGQRTRGVFQSYQRITAGMLWRDFLGKHPADLSHLDIRALHDLLRTLGWKRATYAGGASPADHPYLPPLRPVRACS